MNETKASSEAAVREMYEHSAESYAAMMDTEIDLPLYSDLLGRLTERIANVPGPVIDTSCGPGHVLWRLRERHDPTRSLAGIDLSPRMVALAREKLGSGVALHVGDMRDLKEIGPSSAAAVLSLFAIHHLDANEVLRAFREWHRVLREGAQLVVAAWEGSGPIDYGGHTDVVALRYSEREIVDCAARAGFAVDRCVIEPVEGMPMPAVYLEGTAR